MRLVLKIGLISFAIALATSAGFSQATAQRIPSLVGLRPGEELRLRDARFTESFDSSTYVRTDFIQRRRDRKPVPFFTHQRGISVTLAHAQRFVLINDYFATKGCRVMVADLQTHRDWQIDQAAAQMYRQAAAPDDRLIIVPEAYSFSPDDTKVLIGMDLVDLSVATAQEAAQVSNLYKKWWFVVDTSSGRVLREYRTVEIPKRWYLG